MFTLILFVYTAHQLEHDHVIIGRIFLVDLASPNLLSRCNVVSTLLGLHRLAGQVSRRGRKELNGILGTF